MGFLAKLKAKQKEAEVTTEKVVILAGEELPVDTLKEVIADAFTVGVAFFSIRTDLGGSFIKIAAVVAKYADAPQAFSVAIDQFLDLTPAEAADVTEYVADKFDISNDELESDIEDVLRIPAKGFAALESAKAVFNRVVGIVEDDTMNGRDKAKALAAAASDVVDEVFYIADFIEESLKEIKDLGSAA